VLVLVLLDEKCFGAVAVWLAGPTLCCDSSLLVGAAALAWRAEVQLKPQG
jgi:hypothetical protein